MKQIIHILLLFFITSNAISQDSKNDTLSNSAVSGFNYNSLIVPSIFIGYGILGIESDGLKNLNAEIKEEVDEHIDDKFTFDDISQYTPFLSVYGLNAIGVKGKNNFKDRTIVLATASIIMATTVVAVKNIAKVKRPDGSSNNSFPSGHTATAFMGAEFLYQEYKNESIWYGITGYLVAGVTGFFRIYNDRHWLTDVVAGAGVGILSTKLAYWIHPFIKRSLFKDNKNVDGVVTPYFNGNDYGLGLSLLF